MYACVLALFMQIDHFYELSPNNSDSSWQFINQEEAARAVDQTSRGDESYSRNIDADVMAALRGEKGSPSSKQAADSLLQHVRETGDDEDKKCTNRDVDSQIDPSLKEASQIESKHEIIHLTEHGMEINYSNLHRFRDSAAGQKNTLVVSFLGDTSAGKSHTIRELMGEGERYFLG